MFYGVDCILHHICVTITTYLCPMLILPTFFILNLQAKLALCIVLVVILVYSNYVILFVICVYLIIEIVFHAGVEGHMTYLTPLLCQLSP